MENTSQAEALRAKIAQLEGIRESIWKFRRLVPDELANVKARTWRARWLGLFSLSVAISSLMAGYDAPAPWAFVQGIAFSMNLGIFLWNIIPAEAGLTEINRMISESAADLARCESVLTETRAELEQLQGPQCLS